MTVVVVDTSVYVSALVFGGVPQAALRRAMQPPLQIAVSTEIKVELVETLEGKFHWPVSRVAAVCNHLWETALWHDPVVVQAVRDPDDNHVLGCALAASASVLITGDKDLLALHPFQGLSILTPAAFLMAVNPATADLSGGA